MMKSNMLDVSAKNVCNFNIENDYWEFNVTKRFNSNNYILVLKTSTEFSTMIFNIKVQRGLLYTAKLCKIPNLDNK